MAEEYEDKTAFYAGEGVFCYKKMPISLKNAGATYQRSVDKVFSHQIGRNLHAYVDDMVIKGAERSLAFFKVLKGCKDKKSMQWTTEADKALEKMKKLIQALPTLTAPKVGETLTMYLAASKESISDVLAVKRNEGWTPIYFIGMVLQGAKLNYPALEKLVLALVYAAIELGEQDIVFLKREEKETPADFLIEIPSEDNEKKEKPKEVPDSSSKWRLYTNGAFNSDGSGAGLMLIDPEGKEYTYALRFEFKTTNNEAEYEALLAGLRIAQEMEIAKVAIFLDSQLLVNQIKGTFAAKQASIKDYLQKVKTVLRGFEDYTEVLVKVLTKRSIEEKEVLEVETQERKNWMDPIHEYLLSRLLPEDTREARKIRIQAPQYKLIQENLYKRSFFTPWLRCVAPPQTGKIIKEIHEGSCGFNAKPHSLVVRITEQGFYWPSIHREVAKAIQDCEKCKEESAIRKARTSRSIAESTWPFSHWGIHIIGLLPMAPGGLQFLAIAVEHSTK
ncbi:reverse transcriptase domain-containing protein [Tanacetum coccineum]